MLLGHLRSLKTWSRKTWATWIAVKGCARAIKWAYLLSLSTTTKMTSFPMDFGSPVIKSMLMSTQTSSGIGKGCNSPGLAAQSYLEAWHMEHSLINLLTCLWRPFQWKSYLILFNVRSLPACPLSGEECCQCSNLNLNCSSGLMTILPFFLSNPSFNVNPLNWVRS